MYTVNTQKINEILQNMQRILAVIKPILADEREVILENKINGLAIERVLHVTIESIVDVGNYIIDGFIMRDPGSYVDIIEILEDEGVIPKEVSLKLKAVVAYRKAMVNEYTSIDGGEIYQVIKDHHSTLLEFESYVISYLEKELR